MIKTLQVIRLMTNLNYNQSDIYNELAWISDNYNSNLFELTEFECDQISKIFNDDTKLESAFRLINLQNNK